MAGDRFAPVEPCPLEQTCVLPAGHSRGLHGRPCTDVVGDCPTCGARPGGLPAYRPTRPAPLSETYQASVQAYLDREQPGHRWQPGEVPTGDRNRDR